MNLRGFATSLHKPLPLDAGFQLFACFFSGVALLSAGYDAWLTMLQSQPLKSKLLAKISLGLMQTYKGI